MVKPVSDNVLGNRFWLLNDFNGVDGADAPKPLADPATAKVKHDADIFSFVNGGGDEMAQNAIGKAELFAASHTLSEEAVTAENTQIDNNLRELLGDAGAVGAFVDACADALAAHLEEDSTQELNEFCRTALRKLMATREFDARAHADLASLGTGGIAATDRKLGDAGRTALKNAVCGLASMLRDGRISEQAVVVLADGNFYDASNRGELLRLATDSAKKVKECFINEHGFQTLIGQCRTALREAANLSPQAKTALEQKLRQLEERAETAMNLRKAATASIKTDFQLTDATGKVRSDRKFQKQQLDQVRNSLRAFRYDLDRARDVKMGGMESLRRKADDFFSAKVEHRITRAEYAAMQEADNAFNRLLDEIRQDLFPAADANGQGRVSLAEATAEATSLSHLTNDRIRYHYSGVEKRKAAEVAAIVKELGDIAENNGSRNVTLKAGAKALFDLNLFGALELEAKAGLMFDVTAQIKVDNAGGAVEVTYSIGGKAEGGAFAKVGADPDEEKSAGGVGAEVGAEANFGAKRSVTKTYANLEEFAKTASELNILMTPRPREVFYAWGKSALKGIGHLFMLGATFAGFRIHRSKMDQPAYSAQLRNRNVFGPLGGIFLKKRNVEVLGERKAWSVGGGAQIKAEGGLYFEQEAGGLGSNLEFDAALGADYQREVSVKNKTYVSFAKSMLVCSANYLQGRFDDEIGEVAQGTWEADLKMIVQDAPAGNATALAKSLAKLSDALTKLEESAVGEGKKNNAFWQRFAAQARLLAIATALLTKRAEALGDAVAGAGEAKRAARAVGEYIIPRLANPVVKLPSKIYREQFFNVFAIGKPRTSRFTAFFTGKVDSFGSFIDDKLDDLGIGEEAKDTLVGDLGNVNGNAVADIAKETIGLTGRFEVRVTRGNVVSKHPDPRPWLNDSKTTVDVRLPASAPLRMLLDLVARYYVKCAGGHDKMEDSKWLEEFKDGLLDGIKNSIEDVAIDGAVPFLDLTLGEAAEKSPALKTMLGGVSFLKDKYDADYGFKDDTFKTLRFEFSSGGRFSSFSLAEDYDTEGKLEFTPMPFLEIDLELSSKTSVTDFSVQPRPTVNSILSKAADFSQAGNPEGFANYLARNKKGILRMLEAGKIGAKDEVPPRDKYWEKDCEKMRTMIGDCKRMLDQLGRKQSALGDEARGFWETFRQISEKVLRQEENREEKDALDIAAEFFTAAAKVYTLVAMDKASA